MCSCRSHICCTGWHSHGFLIHVGIRRSSQPSWTYNSQTIENNKPDKPHRARYFCGANPILSTIQHVSPNVSLKETTRNEFCNPEPDVRRDGATICRQGWVGVKFIWCVPLDLKAVYTKRSYIATRQSP
jgi:hypothetical protein